MAPRSERSTAVSTSRSVRIAGNHEFSADKPIFVTQYMTGQSSPGATLGDPAMGNMIPRRST
jgi:hypothetical protein